MVPDTRAILSKIERLEDENERLRVLIIQLRKSQVPPRFPISWKLQNQLADILHLLIDREWISRDIFYTAILTKGNSGNQLDVQVSKLRKKLKPFGVRIETLWGKGYRLAPDQKKLLAQIIEAAQ